MKRGTNIHYISGHCCKGFQGQMSASNCITVKWKFEAHGQQHLVMYVTGVKWMMNWKLNNLLACISMCGVKAHLLHVAVIVLNFGLFLKNCPPHVWMAIPERGYFMSLYFFLGGTVICTHTFSRVHGNKSKACGDPRCPDFQEGWCWKFNCQVPSTQWGADICLCNSPQFLYFIMKGCHVMGWNFV